MRSRLVFVPRLSRTTLCGRVAFAAILHHPAVLGGPQLLFDYNTQLNK